MRLFSLALLLPTVIVSVVSAQAARPIPQDPPPTLPRGSFERVVSTVRLGAQELSVFNQTRLDNTPAGRYGVRINNTLVASAASDELLGTTPEVWFVSEGQPSVLLLGSYTGGTGASAITSYYIKLLVIDDAGVRAFTPGAILSDIPSALVTEFRRTPNNGFTLGLWGGITLTYAPGTGLSARTRP